LRWTPSMSRLSIGYLQMMVGGVRYASY